MALCNICNNLQVDGTTNELADESTLPDLERRQTFALDATLGEWRESAERGCATCSLIWDALLHFHKELVLKLPRKIADEDEPMNMSLTGRLGQTLLLELYPRREWEQYPALEFYSLNGSPETWPIIGPAEEISPSLNLERCLELCKHWITACEQQHPQCQRTHFQTLPTRVLDLGELDKPVNVCLYEPPPGSDACYIALSYCWGKVRNLTTTSSNITQRKAGISWGILSQSFRDVILISRGLGVRYLWIDALCIIQDSTADWEKEAARMGDVYENAFLTIATDAAPDPTHGVLIPRTLELVAVEDAIHKPDKPPGRRNPDVLNLPIKDDTGRNCIIRVREPLLHTDVMLPRSYHDMTYPLLTRAWTMQERLLACRTLHFTAFELIWECKEMLFCECNCISREFIGLDGDISPKVGYERAMAKRRKESDSISRRGNSDNDSRLGQLPLMLETTKAWSLLIGGYSVRQLTFVADKLPAISSLARRYAVQATGNSNPQPELHQTYLAGLWLIDLPWLLCWRAFQMRVELRMAEYCAPTWSWASINTPVIWDADLYNASTKVKVMEAETTPQGSDAFGRVRGGSIVLRGYVKRATLDFNVVHSSVLGLDNGRGERIFFVPDQNPPDVDRDAAKAFSHGPTPDASQRSTFPLFQGEAVVCLWVLHNATTGAVWGLVLASPEEASIKRSVSDHSALPSTAPIFERVGVITGMSWQYQKNDIPALSWFSGAEEQGITII